MGFSGDPSSSSGNSSRRNSLRHFIHWASVTVGDVQIGICGSGRRDFGTIISDPDDETDLGGVNFLGVMIVRGNIGE